MLPYAGFWILVVVLVWFAWIGAINTGEKYRRYLYSNELKDIFIILLYRYSLIKINLNIFNTIALVIVPWIPRIRLFPYTSD